MPSTTSKVDAGFESGAEGANLGAAWTLSGAPQHAEYDSARAKNGAQSGWITGPATAAYAGVAAAETAGMSATGAEIRFWAYVDTANQNRVFTDGGASEVRLNTSGQVMVYTKRTATGYTPNAYTVVGTYADGLDRVPPRLRLLDTTPTRSRQAHHRGRRVDGPQGRRRG